MPSQVLGSGPVGFTDSEGRQQFIPLSALEFNDEGKPQLKKESSINFKETEIVNNLLQTLADSGFLTASPEPPPKPAMLLEAAVPGAEGNNIQVTFSNIKEDLKNPANTTFDAVITAKQTYSGLSLDNIKTVLGTAGQTGTSPGLVFYKKDGETGQLLPKKGDGYGLKNGADNAKSFVSIPGEPTDPAASANPADLVAFQLEAWKNGSDGNNITVSIPDVDKQAKTFTLVIEFKSQKVTGINVTNLDTKLGGDFLVIKVSQPKDKDKKDAGFAIPAPGTITLSGGADAKNASPASATVFSK